MYYKMETMGFDEDGDMEADVPFAQMQNEYSFGVPLQAQNSVGYQQVNDFDVQMDDEEETKSVMDNMSQLRDNNVLGNQSAYNPENPQSDDPFSGDNDAMDRMRNDSWLKLRRGTFEPFDLNNVANQFTAERNASFDRIQSQFMELMSAGNGSARKLSALEAERRRLSSVRSKIS